MLSSKRQLQKLTTTANIGHPKSLAFGYSFFVFFPFHFLFERWRNDGRPFHDCFTHLHKVFFAAWNQRTIGKQWREIIGCQSQGIYIYIYIVDTTLHVYRQYNVKGLGKRIVCVCVCTALLFSYRSIRQIYIYIYKGGWSI